MPAPNGRLDRSPDRSIVLVGFMAAGKSRIGRILAERLKLPFIDTDREIERSYGVPIAAIFAERGEAEFRKAERELILRLLSEKAQVIAIGGGAFVDSVTRSELNRKARTVWLDVPLEIAMDRLARSDARPLATSKSEEELRALWEERRKCYAEAHVRIDVSKPDQTRIIAQIVGTLRQAGRG
jgi:shikimate kinase